jgi:DNA-binding GntR family transcriptional regulator
MSGTAEPAERTFEAERREAKTLVEFVYQRTREEILSGRLPPGSKLKVEKLKTNYAVGASTMREALSLLVADALVVAEGQRGFRVAPTSVEDLADVINLRKTLETQALRESIESGTDQWEAAIVAAFHQLSLTEERIFGQKSQPLQELLDEWEERNRVFHDALLDGCHSKWLRHFRNILYQQSERYRRIAFMAHPGPRDVREEHKQIMAAALARDVELACRLTEEHLDRTLEAVRKRILINAQSRTEPSVRSSRQH